MKAVLFAVAAGLCWGVGEVCSKGVLKSGRVGPMTVLLVRTALALPLAGLVYALAYYGTRSEPQEWWRAGPRVLAMLGLGSAVLAGFGGVYFFYLGLAHGEVSRVKPIAFALAPAVAVGLGWMLLGEPMTARKLAGAGMIVVGVVLLMVE